MTDDVARALPAYEVHGEIGRGAHGRVLAGRHRRLGRAVAIKQLDGSLAHDEAYRAAFLREAQVMAELSHPHVVHVYDFVEDDDLLLLVMEHLDRGSLDDAHRRGDVSAETACGAVMAACAGVQFVHERGVLHRDLKPENLMLDSAATLKVTDFGLARADGDARRTRQGDLLGSPAYMAPEQAAGGEVGPAADVYALGASLYYLLSGAFPHDVEGGTMAVLQRRVSQPARPLGQLAPQVPGPLVEVVMAAVAVDPGGRPTSAEALGVSVAAAAWEAWGPGWIDRSAVQVRAPGRVLRATETEPAAGWRDEMVGAPPDGVTATVDTRASASAPSAGDAPGGRRAWLLAAVGLVALVVLGAVVVLARQSDDAGVAEAVSVTPVWTLATGGEVFASPAASGPNAIVGSVDGTVYAIDARDGREVWRAPTGGAVRSSAAVDGDRAYVGSFDGNVYALDVATGAEVWRAPAGYEVVSSPAVASGLVMVGGGGLVAFDAATGDRRWVFETSGPVVSSPAVAGSAVVVGGSDGVVYGVGLDGVERWRHQTGAPVQSSPAVADGVVFVGSTDGALYALDADDGTLLWSTPLGATVKSSPAVAGGVVYVGTGTGALVALDVGDGDEVWRASLTAAVDSSPLVHAGQVVVGSNDRALHGFDAASGAPVWTMTTGDVVLSSPAVVAEVIVVGSDDRKVYGVRP